MRRAFAGSADSSDNPNATDIVRDHPEVSLVATESFLDRRECWPSVSDTPDKVSQTFTIEDVIRRTHFAPSSALIRKTSLEAVGLFDPTLRCVCWRSIPTRAFPSGARS